MYNPIQLTYVSSKEFERNNKKFLEQFSLDPFISHSESSNINVTSEIFMEAVFKNGKETVAPIIEHIQKIKDLLDSLIEAQDNSLNSETQDSKERELKLFDPNKFWKDPLFKELEDKVRKIFGFRNVEISPYIEKYDSKSKEFETKIMNCEVSHLLRYPIDGIVTDKGFYDSSHSLNMNIWISLGLLKALSADEVMAVLLHEFGHSIDPAIVDIKYIQVNILSKYLTDRKRSINKTEQKFIKEHKLDGFVVLGIIYSLIVACSFFTIAWSLIKDFKDIFVSKKEKERRKKAEEKRIREESIERIRSIIRKDPKFNRQNYGEAFADNFARMYGFGAALMSGLKKSQDRLAQKIRSRIEKEEDRQKAILYIVECTLKDEHKTNIHRIRSLIKEYEDDLNDPNISTSTKKEMKEDLEELKKILDSYLNSFGKFQNHINKIINEELERSDNKASHNKKSENKDKKDDNGS